MLAAIQGGHAQQLKPAGQDLEVQRRLLRLPRLLPLLLRIDLSS